jgi:hypothetical protein
MRRRASADNPPMNALHWLRIMAAATMVCAAAAAQIPRESSVELETSLFVQLPGGKFTPGAVQLVWIPEPLVKYCLGKTHQQCASMDFCIRTTTKNVSTCRNLAVDLAHLPTYPADMSPRRMLSIAMIPPTIMKGWDELEAYMARVPKETLEHFSSTERVRAKVAFTRKPDDDDFRVVEILAVPKP